MKYGNKFMYLIESTCKKNQTYNFNSVYLHVLVLFNICNPFKVAPRIEKTEVFKKKLTFCKLLLFSKSYHEKIFFYYGGKKQCFFFIFIIKLSSTALSYLNAHST